MIDQHVHNFALAQQPGTLFAAPAASGDIASDWFEAKSVGGGTFHARWGGNLAGEFHVWISNEPTPTDGGFEATGDNFLIFKSGTDPAGSAGQQMIQLGSPVKARWYRVTFVHTGGTGALDGWIYV